MNTELKKSLKTFALEAGVYGVLVFAYFFLVLHLLGEWLETLFERNRHMYAAVALALIIFQGVLLEALTRLLLSILQRRTEDR